MNPDETKPTEDQWQQPVTSNGQAPYVAPTENEAPTPVVVSEYEAPAEPQEDAVADQPNSDQSVPSTTELLYANDDDAALIRWQSTEYIHQEKSPLWYVILALITLVLMAVAYIVIGSLTFTILLPVMAVTLVLYTRRPPAINDYSLSRKGIHVNDKLFTYDQFRSFGVITMHDHHAAVLVPRRRFQLGQTLYFPEEVGEKLVDMLAERLPMNDAKPDAIDRILARLRL
jgi:hypothetical protein